MASFSLHSANTKRGIFRYDASLGGYIYNLSLKGYATGTYRLSFTAGADPTTHTVDFQVK